jgi:Protein of unknown function (DUF1217)
MQLQRESSEFRLRAGEAPLSTTSTYISIENNLASYQKMTANQPAVKTATEYYQANIGKVTTVAQFVSNYRLLSYALQAYGLGNQINNKALITKVLEQGTTSSKALANTLPNVNWKKFAEAFNFSATGSSSPTSSTSVSTTVADYTEQQLETNEGASDPGVQLALYFKRVAPTVTSGYSILADSNLLQVVQSIFKLAPTDNASEIDKEATEIEKLVPTSDLQNPTKLEQLTVRFTAAYDTGDDSLTVESGNTTTTVSAASSVLTNLVSNNASLLASYEGDDAISASLLFRLQGLTLGG